MASVREEGELGAGVDEVWKLVGDFSGFVEAMGIPVETEGEGIGSTRTLAMGGSPTIERLEKLDNENQTLQYSLLQGPLPVENYLSTMHLSAISEGRTRLEWSSEFDAAGIPEADAIEAIRGIYKGGIAGLQARFGA
jgi:hypothetical protein